LDARHREGLTYGLIAYGWWGLVPLYFRLLTPHLGAFDILAHRVLWSMAFLAAVLSIGGRWGKVRKVLRLRPVVLVLLATTLLIAVNWFMYIFAVERRQVVQASLGYFLTPLLSVLLGMVFFRERLRPLQWLALLAAAAGVVRLAVLSGEWPWISITLALSFGFYGLLRKRIPVDGLTGLSVETFFLVPLTLAYFLFAWLVEPAEAWDFDVGLAILLLLSGVVTAVPLLCFGQAAQRLPLSTLGFLQFLSPSVQFVLAVALLGEPLDEARLLSFVVIWAGLALFCVDLYVAHARK
jgi:chloramphenicol-sensitive protein RarD